MDSERLWRFRKPQWLNNATTRLASVYLSGGLVCSPLPHERPDKTTDKSRSHVLIRSVCTLGILYHRRRRLLQILTQRLLVPCHLRRLDPSHLLYLGHAGHQLH